MEAINELKEISLIDSLRYEHELRLKARRDREAQDEYVYERGKEEGVRLGREDGIKVGKEEGAKLEREEGIQKLVNSLRRNNYSDEEIIKELMTEYKLDREDAEQKLK